jgi:predicted nucleotidyltransferase
MPQRVSPPTHLIYPIGTQVVSLVEIYGAHGRMVHPRGAVGVIVQSPADNDHAYRVRFPDGFEAALYRKQLVILAHYKRGVMDQAGEVLADYNLYDRVIFRCIVGSRAFGLDDDASDTDRRGIYLPPADLQWSLYGVPEQLESESSQEAYWELQKFITMALKANPNILECLYTPLVEHATPLARELLAIREAFLSRMVYQTYNGYVMSQFKKLSADLRNHGQVKWKHVMHLIRLLLAGVIVLRDGYVPVLVGEHRERLLAIRRGEEPWEEVETWRLALHQQLTQALASTKLPEQPDYERANAFLIKARRAALEAELP